MKKIVLLLLIIFTSNVFSQTYNDSSSGKFDKMANLANHNKDDEAKKIADELLSAKYGELSGFEKFYTLLVVADYYYQKDDYQKASDSYQQFLDFNKNENPKKIDNKKIYLDEAKGKLEELKPKLALVSANTSNPAVVTDAAKGKQNQISDNNPANRSLASDNSNSQADEKETNTDKTVTLTVSGTGKTLEEARLNALRSAIEQAFGAFISSKTEILNDNLVKDEIVSIASGNVQKYNVVSQIEIPNTGYAITLSATVSISKLTSFAESKGVVVEFKGGLFAENVKLQRINEESELIAIKNLTDACFELLKNSFEYELNVSEPISVENSTENYEVNFNISTKENQNYNNFKNYFISTIQNIAISNEEYENIKKRGNTVRYLYMDEKLYRLRNEKSSDILSSFFVTSQMLLINFKITFNSGELEYNKLLGFKNELHINAPLLNGKILLFCPGSGCWSSDMLSNKVYKKELSVDDLRFAHQALRPLSDYIGGITHSESDNKIYSYKNCMALFNKDFMEEFLKYDSSYKNDIIFFNTKFNSPEIKFKKIFNITELQKIDVFKIEKKPFN